MTKKIAFCNLYDSLNKDNFLFENTDSLIGDELLKPFVHLKQIAESRGIEAGTVDVMDLPNCDSIVFIDLPNKNNPYLREALANDLPIYLITFESELIAPFIGNHKAHQIFTKIFTWADELVDNQKYYKINFSFERRKSIPRNLAAKEKFCTLIAGNKKIIHPRELYSSRLDAIRWFEKHHPTDLDLYGTGWDEFYFPGKLRLLNRSRLLKKTALLKPFPSFRGAVIRKREILKRYKFSICYENACDYSGYITEKIFDSLFAGCIPIYRGADNIAAYIPKGCFIDQRDFPALEDLYMYLKGFDAQSFNGYYDAIEEFLCGDKFYPFSLEYFANTLLHEIAGDQ